MIVRSWHGIVPVDKAGAFRLHLLHTGVAEAKATPGNLGTFIYSQTHEGWEHFFMVSYWIDMEAVCAFAGLLPHVAVTYPDDEQFDLISDPIVLHHEVKTVPTDFPIPANLSNQ
jgi:heme-degrading monooxygenase HmoA